MPITPYPLPWAPAAGDFAPRWSARTFHEQPVGWDAPPHGAQLLCFLPGAGAPAVAEFAAGLARGTLRLAQAGCQVRCFVATRDDAASADPGVVVAIDDKLLITKAFCLPLPERRAGSPAPRVALVARDGRLLEVAPVGVNRDGAALALAMADRHAPFAASLPIHPPVLHLPGVLSPALCEELIAAFRAGSPAAGKSITLRDGRVEVAVQPDVKSRDDLRLAGPLLDRVWAQLVHRLFPAAREAFHFEITRYEYLQIGRYASEPKGFFRPHRDDSRPGTRHRRFALTLNLNDGYAGGALRFPGYDAEYTPAPGAAVLFSCSMLHEARPVVRGERFILVGMFWGEAEVAEAERSRAVHAEDAAAEAAPPHAVRRRQLGLIARLVREVAGDVDALGPHLDGPAAALTASDRLDVVRRGLARLRGDLGRVRRAFVDDQVAQLGLGAAPRGLKLHLGCGEHRLEGFIDVDARGGDVRADVRWGLPFPDASARFVFASHVVEHLYRDLELPALLKEIHRVLEPGGVARIVVPDIEQCLRAYVEGDDAFFEARKETWPWARDMKTRLAHFLTYAGANQPLERFDTHKYGYDFETLAVALREAGFETIERSGYLESEHPELRVDDRSDAARARSPKGPYSLFVEATR